MNPSSAVRRGCRRIVLIPAFSVLALSGVRADESENTPLLEFAVGLPGKQVKLTWISQPGVRYMVEKSTDLGAGSGGGGGGGAGGWTRVAMVEAGSDAAEWRDPEAVSAKCFYRVSKPAAEVFSISPTVLSPTGGVILIHGQCLPAGAVLVLEIEGLGVLTFPLEYLTGTTWRAVIGGALPPGARVISVSVRDALGNTITTIDQEVTITGTGRAEDAPPGLPPAAPVPSASSNPIPGVGIVVKRGTASSEALAAPSDNDCDDADEVSGASAAIIGILTRTGYAAYNALATEIQGRSAGCGPTDDIDLASATSDDCDDRDSSKTSGCNPLYASASSGADPFSRQSAPSPSGMPGEVSFQQTDLALSSPAGPPLVWVRTYRSMKPVSSGHGGQWDFSYNISIETIPAGAGPTADRVVIHDGGGRADTFHRQSDGSFRCDGFFREGSFTGDVFTLKFADTGRWVFKPLNGSPEAGKIDQITDRNGVSLTCAYNPAGMLESVGNVFGRSISVTWSAAGDRIERVTDNGGRSYDYSYYGAGDPDGGEGMLQHVTPPGSGALRFTYSTGSGDPRLDGNLLASFDGESRLIEAFTYSGATDPLSLDYDACVSHDRNRVGTTGEVCVSSREALPADQQPYGGYRIFEVDEIGRVNLFVCDAMHRTVSRRTYTGFTTPGVPVSSSTLALTGKRRDADPDWFEYACDFNADHLCTRYTQPDGSQARITYQRELHRGAPVCERGNARVLALRSPSGQLRSVSCDYQPGFGTPEACRPGAPIKGISVKGGRNPGGSIGAQDRAPGPGTDPTQDDTDGADFAAAREIKIRPKGWDGTIKGNALVWSPRSNFTSDDEDCDGESYARTKYKGWDGTIKGRASEAALKKEEGGRHTPFHNKYRPQYAARGITINTSHVEYATAQAASDDCDDDCDGLPDDDIEFFRKILDRGEAGDNVALTRMVTAHGQTYQWSYDAHGNPLSAITPVPGHGILYQHNALGQCVSVEMQDGARVFRDEFTYSPTTGELELIIRDKTAAGTGLQLTTTFARDTYGRATDVTDPGGATWSYQYNALDQCTLIQSPPVPARISTNLIYDHAGTLVRCDTDHLDPAGAPDGVNPAYSTFWQRDSRGRLTRVSTEERPVNPGPADTPDTLGIQNFAVCDIARDDAGQVVKLSTPAACREQATDETIDYQFDERGLLFRRVAGNVPGSTPLSTQCDYDAKGRLVRRATLTGGTTDPADTYAYDSFGRLASCTDPMGNVCTLDYDNIGAVTVSFFGELNDVAGSAGNQLLAQSTTRKRVEVLKSNKQGDPNANRSSREILKSYFQTGDIPTQEQRISVGAAFFGFMVADETISVQRFTPGSGAPPQTELTTIHRSPAGLVESITINGDLVQSRDYDSAGRMNHCWDASCSVSLTHDNRGDVVVCGETDHFSVMGVPSKTYTHAFTRDALGRVTSHNDGIGNGCLYSYDSLGRVRMVSPPGRQPVVFEYDGSSTTGSFSVRTLCDIAGTGSLTNIDTCYSRCGDSRYVSNSSGDTTYIQRDACGRVISCDFPDGTHETTTYDTRGLTATGTFSDGSSRDITSDNLGRVLSETWTPPVGVTPSPPTTYQHDGLGRCVNVEQGTNAVSFIYDSVSNKVSEIQTRAAGMAQISSTFNHRGRTQVTYPGGVSYNETRGVHGELLTVTELGKITPKIAKEHHGRRVWREARDNGTVTTHTYRADGEAPLPGPPDASFDRCVETTVTKSGVTLSHVIVRRDADQAVSRIETAYSEIADPPGRVKSITRDGLGRLTACVTEAREVAGGPLLPVDSVSYELSADGLRVSEIRNGLAGAYTQDATIPPADRQMGQYSTWPGGALEWDDAGNLLRMQRGTQPGLHFESDVQGRVVAVRETDASGVPTNLLAEFTHDPLGRVMLHKIHRGAGLPSVDTSFVYDGSVCIQELSSTGAVESTYVCADGAPVALETGTSSYQLHTAQPTPDSAASGVNPRICTCPPGWRVSLVTDASGTPSQRYDCDDAGKPVFLDAAGLPTTDAGPVKWMAPECLWVPETGMLHGAGGAYSPNLGTWVAKPKKKKATAIVAKPWVPKGHVSLLK